MDYLFRRLDGFQYFAEKDKLLKEEISKLSDIELQSSDESLKIILKAQNNVQLILFVNDYRSDNGEIQVNIRDDPRFGAYLSRDEDRKPVFKKARQILIHLPFSGSKELFDVRPLTRSFGGYPRAEIKNNEVLFTVEFFSDVDKAEDVEKKISKQIEFIKTYAGWLNDNINSFNSSIDSIIDSELIARRRKLSQDETILGKLGISNKAIPPIGFVKPEKKLDLKILDNKVEKIDPSLEMQTYDEIIRIINGLGINLERSCERLRSLGEPLRDSILGALNTFYKGMASAEAFNKEGKTDILLKYQDHNIFIAECKIWSTEDVFISGITQLLSYLTWRDTKTSYIIFSKNMDVRNVINKSKKLSERNSNFVSKVKDISDSCITYRFKIDLKTKSECYLTLHVFDLGLEP